MTNQLRGTHGRIPAFATGVKLANPELTVVVTVGDGDGVTIGGNHFIHAARRNVDITVVIVNNFNYGMTGGQYSGTTPEDSITTTSRLGHIEEGFDICKLAVACGATYVARSTSENVLQTTKMIEEGIRHKGFSLIEVISMCPTHFGRYNGMKTPVEQMEWIRKKTVSIAAAEKMSEEELEGKIVVGRFAEKKKDDYSTRYLEVQAKAKAEIDSKESGQAEEKVTGKLSKKWEVIFAGVGGQGALLCGSLIGEAAAILEKRQATMLGAYGGEARGTYAKSDLLVGNEPNAFVETVNPNLVVALHEIAYQKHVGELDEEALLIYNNNRIAEMPSRASQVGLPMDDLASEAGNKGAANMVGMGAAAKLTDIASPESIIKMIEKRFSGKDTAIAINVDAFWKGYHAV